MERNFSKLLAEFFSRSEKLKREINNKLCFYQVMDKPIPLDIVTKYIVMSQLRTIGELIDMLNDIQLNYLNNLRPELALSIGEILKGERNCLEYYRKPLEDLVDSCEVYKYSMGLLSCC